MMTVKQLIEELKKYDENLPVKIMNSDFPYAENIKRISQHNWDKGVMWGTCIVLRNDSE